MGLDLKSGLYRHGIFLCALGLGACGSPEGGSSARYGTYQIDSRTQKSYQLKAFSPLSMSVDAVNSQGQFSLVPVVRTLNLFEYDSVIEAEIADDRVSAMSFVTGIALDVVDSKGAALGVTLSVEAREFNSQTGQFSGSTRIFAPQGANLVGAQNFTILNSNSPNYVMTGLGLRLKDARVSRLQLARKSLSNLYEDPENLQGAAVVILPAGWVATGFQIKLAPIVNGSTTTHPYVQDALLSIAQLIQH